jgi:hypothetical protein
VEPVFYPPSYHPLLAQCTKQQHYMLRCSLHCVVRRLQALQMHGVSLVTSPLMPGVCTLHKHAWLLEELALAS